LLWRVASEVCLAGECNPKGGANANNLRYEYSCKLLVCTNWCNAMPILSSIRPTDIMSSVGWWCRCTISLRWRSMQSGTHSSQLTSTCSRTTKSWSNVFNGFEFECPLASKIHVLTLPNECLSTCVNATAYHSTTVNICYCY
jgi:hypothetical protein